MFKNKYKSSTKKAPSLGRALEEWIDFPSGHTSSLTILFNSLILPFKWLLWISKGVAGLTLTESLRERLRDQSTSLGSVAALYLVITVSAFLTPPGNEIKNMSVVNCNLLVFSTKIYFRSVASRFVRYINVY